MSQGPLSPRILVFSFCAIPGVGKSTLLKHLQKTGVLEKDLPKNTKVIYVQEPVDQWRERGWLQQFYQDPSQNAAAFQFLVFDSHVDSLAAAIAAAKEDSSRASAIFSPSPRGSAAGGGGETEAHEEQGYASPTSPRGGAAGRGGYSEGTASADADADADADASLVVLVERSFYCQRLFWQVQVDNACASANALYNDAYVRLWSKWRHFIPEPSHMFFLYTSELDETMRRVDARDRAEEKKSGLTKAYQAQLLAKHEAWYTEPVARPPGCPTEGVPCTRICLDEGEERLKNAVLAICDRVRGHILQN